MHVAPIHPLSTSPPSGTVNTTVWGGGVQVQNCPLKLPPRTELNPHSLLDEVGASPRSQGSREIRSAVRLISTQSDAISIEVLDAIIKHMLIT